MGGVDPSIYDLAEALLSDIPGATSLDVVRLADALQSAFEGAANEIEEREKPA